MKDCGIPKCKECRKVNWQLVYGSCTECMKSGLQIGDRITISGNAIKDSKYVLDDMFTDDHHYINPHKVENHLLGMVENEDYFSKKLAELKIPVITKEHTENKFPKNKDVVFVGFKNFQIITYILRENESNSEGTDWYNGERFGVEAISTGTQRVACYKEGLFSKEKYCFESQIVGLIK